MNTEKITNESNTSGKLPAETALTFEAKTIHSSKNSQGKYYMVGLADDKFDYKNYILFQKPYELGKYDDPNAEMNGIYIECNGDICYNGCTSAILKEKTIEFVIEETPIIIDISNIKITEKFTRYLKEILGDILIFPTDSVIN